MPKEMQEEIIEKLLAERVDPRVKYHSPLPGDLAPWYVYTVKSGYRILCVLRNDIAGCVSDADYRSRLVSAPVKTVLRGYDILNGFVVIDSTYSPDTGFISEQEDREFDAGSAGIKHALTAGEPYLPGTTNWPEAVEYNYFSNSHELRFFLKNPSRYVTEVIAKMPVQLGLFVQGDIILLVYSFTDYKKHLIPVHGYSPFSIHLVPDNLRTLPESTADAEYEDLLRVHLVDAATGILKAARTVTFSAEFTAALRAAIIEQAGIPLTGEYNDRLRAIDGMYPDTESLLSHCRFRCAG